MLVGESSQATQSLSAGSDVGKETSATTSESSGSAHQAKQQSTGGASSSSKSQQKSSGSDQEATTSAKKRPSDIPRPLAVKVCSLHESHIQLFSNACIMLTFTEI